MKKLSSVDVVGSVVLAAVVVTIIGLFVFASNGQYVANLVIR